MKPSAAWWRSYPWREEFQWPWANLSHEDPRRLWFKLPFLGEIRFYLWGVELNLGPVLCFVGLSAGTLGFEAKVVRGVW